LQRHAISAGVLRRGAHPLNWNWQTEKFIVGLALKPVKTSATVIAGFLTTIGIVRGLVFLNDELNFQFAIIAGMLLIWLILFIFIIWIMFDIKRIYKRNSAQSFVYNDVEQHWHINRDGSRNVSCDKVMLFHRDPTEDELVDTLFGSVGLSFEDMKYATKEAQVIRTEQPRPDAYNVFWKPPSPIYAGDIYTHSFQYLFPKGETPYEKSITAASLTPCRSLRISVTSDRKIKQIRAKEDGGEVQFWDEEKIMRPSNVNYPGYISDLKERSFSININNLDLEKVIFVMIEFEEKE